MSIGLRFRVQRALAHAGAVERLPVQARIGLVAQRALDVGEAPLLPIVETYLLRDPDARETVLRDLGRYVIKPTGASGGYGVAPSGRAAMDPAAAAAAAPMPG